MMILLTSYSYKEMAEGFRESFYEGVSMVFMNILYGIGYTLSIASHLRNHF